MSLGNQSENLLFKFLHDVKNTIGQLATVNIIILLALIIYTATKEILIYFLYTVFDIASQWFNQRHIIQQEDHTSLLIYLLIILVGLILCLYLIKSQEKHKLWQ